MTPELPYVETSSVATSVNAKKGMKISTYFLSVLQSVMFNSMPVDMMETNGNKTEKQKKNSISSDAKLHEGQIRQRIEMLLKYLRKYGVPEKHLFEVHELQEMSNIPKVTRCIAMLGKMVRKHTVFAPKISVYFKCSSKT